MFLHNYRKPSAQLSALENFFLKKYTHAGSIVNTTLPAFCIYYFTLQILQHSAQNPFRAEDFCSIIIEAHIFETKSHRCDTTRQQMCYSGREVVV